ncbi:hypothetical protein O7543_15465 [Solwaraspora sp. WMMA2080]|uniref:hypothetical protein n=1 Tax=unclassified Solwaraspora TaxID=2627926 RepID=UPI00248C4344|nr:MULTISPECIES: hypothetical protein [unclassified Solwaraspora]WBB97750.1 hypothetical protein O7553_01880 [Solwaraspora sp. WMMA2059]WBC18360.1 hypothetical protein O7543_15465 [Solwaraspora sp. WMMA2080]
MTLTAEEIASVWTDYRRITRFFYSAQIAFNRERILLESLSLKEPEQTKARVPLTGGSYRFYLADHLSALADVRALCSAVLTQTYTLAETAALASFSPPGDSRSAGGIEVWGEKLLKAQGKDWNALACGKAGVVEVAVARNLSVHGDGRIGISDARRLREAGVIGKKEGEEIPLTVETTTEYRGRLKDLLNEGGILERNRNQGLSA